MPEPLAFTELKCPNCGYALQGLPKPVCPECGFNFDPVVLRWRLRHARRRLLLRSLLIMAIAVYLPFSWLLFIDYPWSDHHWLWLRMWPILPGLPATILLRAAGTRLPDWIELICMGVFTLLALGFVTRLGARGTRWLIVTAIIMFALSCFNGWIGYLLFQL